MKPAIGERLKRAGSAQWIAKLNAAPSLATGS
jgi:hypothetical protein